MHELSLCEAIADKVRSRAEGRSVFGVVVRIGALRQVVPDALSFCWEVLTDATDLDGAKLEIEQVAAVVLCRECEARTQLETPVLVCRACESHNVGLVTGDEFLVVALEIAEA